MFVIAAEFNIKPDQLDDFKKLIGWQAERSVAEEAGCLQFDVCQNEDKPEVFLLYEVYADTNAFDEKHVKIPRFEEFIAKAEPVSATEPVVNRMTRIFANAK